MRPTSDTFRQAWSWSNDPTFNLLRLLEVLKAQRWATRGTQLSRRPLTICKVFSVGRNTSSEVFNEFKWMFTSFSIPCHCLTAEMNATPLSVLCSVLSGRRVSTRRPASIAIIFDCTCWMHLEGNNELCNAIITQHNNPREMNILNTNNYT